MGPWNKGTTKEIQNDRLHEKIITFEKENKIIMGKMDSFCHGKMWKINKNHKYIDKHVITY